MSRYLGASPGFVVAVDLPPGPAWLDVMTELWAEGAAILPLDRRLTARDRRGIVDLARPASVVTADDEVLFADPEPLDPERAGLVMSTSGTAGRFKLVELSRTAVSAAVGSSFVALRTTNSPMALEPSEPWICCLSPAHMGGMMVLLRRLLFDTPVIVLERFDVQAFALGRISPGAHVSLVPTMLHRLVDALDDLSHIGVLLVGGGGLDPELGRRAAERGGHVVSTYGLTETSGGIAYDGRLFEGSRARTGAADEIELLGPTLMEGYRLDPAATASAFTLDGWLRTGDAGAVEDTGHLRVHGRLDDTIRVGAETVWPQKVEAALADHPKVSDVAVAGRPDPEWGAQVVAFVVPAAAADPPTLEELRDHVRESLPRFMAPRALVLMTDLPRTVSGKLRRGSLP
ncbi:MAG: class I adenylate-forming enzyme family protein [Actinomycetota bacterium]